MPSDWRPSCQTLTIHIDGVAVCEVRGDLDSSNVTILHHAVAVLAEYPAAILDLRRVGFIDSAGLGVVISSVRRAVELQTRLAVVTGKDHTTRLLRTVGIARMVPVVASLDDALEAVQPLREDRHRGAIGKSAVRRLAM